MKVGSLIRNSHKGFARSRIPSPYLSRGGRGSKNPLQLFIEELVNAGVNAQVDAFYLAETNKAGRKGERLLSPFSAGCMERPRVMKKSPGHG